MVPFNQLRDRGGRSDGHTSRLPVVEVRGSIRGSIRGSLAHVLDCRLSFDQEHTFALFFGDLQ